MKDVNEISRAISSIAEKQKLTGLSLAQIDNSSIKYSNFGLSDIINQTHVTENIIFEFASLTKPIVSIIAVKVFQAYQIPLKTKISDLVSEYKIYPDITLLDILSHSTGFPNWPSDSHNGESYFTPGSRFSYSGFGFNLLEKIFIKLSGKNSEQLLQSLVCKPLSLKNTSLIFEESKKSQTAIGSKNGRPMSKWKPNSPSLAGSLHSSVFDYATIIQDIFSTSPVLFNEITRKQLFQKHQNVNCDFSNNISWPNKNIKQFKDIFWGLGWGIESAGDFDFYWHWGDNDIFQSFFWIDPKERKGLLLVTNCENGNKTWEVLTKAILKKDLKSIEWLKQMENFQVVIEKRRQIKSK